MAKVFSFTYYQFPKFSLSWQMAWQVDFALIALKATKMKNTFQQINFAEQCLQLFSSWIEWLSKNKVTLSATVHKIK